MKKFNSIRTNFNILKTFVNKAKHVLCLSADINPTIVNNFMKEFNTLNEPVFLQENTKSIISNTKYNVYLDKDFL